MISTANGMEDSALARIKPVGRTPRVKVRDSLLQWIRANRLQAGDKLPSQMELAKALGAGSRTVHHAMAGLVEQGIVRRRPGEGTILLRSLDAVGVPDTAVARRAEDSGGTERMDGPLAFVHVASVTDNDFTTVSPSPMDTSWLIVRSVERALQDAVSDQALVRTQIWHEDAVPADALLRTAVRGAVLFWGANAAHVPQLEAMRLGMQRVAVPVVNVGLGPLGVPDVANAVYPDQLALGAAAARHLWDLGHRRLLVGHSSLRMPFEQERIRSFRGFMGADGGRVTLYEGGEPCAAGDWMPVGRKVFAAWVASGSPGDRPTGVFCVNDGTAVGFILAAREAGIKVPEDVSVVGVDNFQRLFYPYGVHLTTLDQEFDEVGDEAVRLLRGLIRGEIVHSTVIKVQPRLVVRGTTAPPMTARAGGEAV